MQIVDSPVAKSVGGSVRREYFAVFQQLDTAAEKSEPETAGRRIDNERVRVLSMSEARPRGLINDSIVGEMKQTSRRVREPHIPLQIASNGVHSSARYAGYGVEPAIVEVSNGPHRGHPDPVTFIFEKRTAREADTVHRVHVAGGSSSRRRRPVRKI